MFWLEYLGFAASCGKMKLSPFIIGLAVIIILIEGQTEISLANATYNGNQITLVADSRPLKDILLQLKNSTGIEFLADDMILNDVISISIYEKKIDVAIKQLLKKYNTLISYDESGKILSVKAEPKHLVSGVRNEKSIGIIEKQGQISIDNNTNTSESIVLQDGGILSNDQSLLKDIVVTPISEINTDDIAIIKEVPAEELPIPTKPLQTE